MRTMKDSTNVADTRGAQLRAGYINGLYRSVEPGVAVQISVFAPANQGNCLDVESGDATPSQAPGWVRMRRAAGVDPSVYCSEYTWPAVQASFRQAGVAPPHYWIANWNGKAEMIPGAIAHQYCSPGTGSGGHWDLSLVADFWPGVDQAPVPAPAPPSPVYHPTWHIYWVRLGDSLSRIAYRLGFSLRTIEQWNPQLNRGHNFNLIYPGDRVHYLK